MISIQEGKDFEALDVLARSPVANIPGAKDTLRDCLRRSVVYQGKIGEQVACVWGLIPPTLLSDTAYLWLLTTDIVASHKFLFVRYSQLFIEDMLKLYPVIVGDCQADNKSAIRWLKWLGAEFTPGTNGKLTFVIRRK